MAAGSWSVGRVVVMAMQASAVAQGRRQWWLSDGGGWLVDAEIRSKKDDCYVDVESGMWGWNCKSSIIAKENCALKCLSPRCYEIVYESDPLEEGEKDLVRSQEYKFCLYK
ncbi:hypothetical protein KSS87_021686 [Heliosperma pusillum]|nr:hypothetical protein KSS87_021135 [Heliosperma pusillum]KAH9622146.1 hypothetical protein KSS87_021686 [Heliosperma pusillum]